MNSEPDGPLSLLLLCNMILEKLGIILNVLKKASGSWAEPYSLAPLLVLRGFWVYLWYTLWLSGHIQPNKWYTVVYTA